MRILRLVIGGLVVAQGIQMGEWMLVFFGALFSLMPLLNIGCCAVGNNCNVRPSRKFPDDKTEEITYQEVK